MRPAVLDGAQAFFLDSPGQGRHPPPRLSGELSLVDTVGWSGVLSLTLQAPPELLSLLTAGGGENPSLAVCFAGTCASPSVLGAHLPFFKVFGRKLLPLHLSSFVAAALKKKLGLLFQSTGARSCMHSLSVFVICIEFYMLHLTQNL